MNNFEAQWAVALKKSRQKNTVNNNPTSLDKQKEQIEEEMKYFKKKLLECVRNKDQDEAQKTLSRLYVIRARKLNLDIKELEERYGTAPKPLTEDLIKRYYYDCYSLTIIVNKELK